MLIFNFVRILDLYTHVAVSVSVSFLNGAFLFLILLDANAFLKLGLGWIVGGNWQLATGHVLPLYRIVSYRHGGAH